MTEGRWKTGREDVSEWSSMSALIFNQTEDQVMRGYKHLQSAEQYIHDIHVSL